MNRYQFSLADKGGVPKRPMLVIMLGKYGLKKAFALSVCAFIVCLNSAGSVRADSNSALTITNISVVQQKNETWLNVWFSGYQTISDDFKLIFTQPQVLDSKFSLEFSFANKWLSSGVSFKFLANENTKEGQYQYTALAVAKNGLASSPFSFSFNYSKPTWQQAGCSDLSELNAEWRDEWHDVQNYKTLADMEVNTQNKYGQFHNLGCSNLLAWKVVAVKIKQFVWRYTLCSDGWKSYSTGSGTCSWHGGISDYRGYNKTVNAKRIQFYWLH